MMRAASAARSRLGDRVDNGIERDRKAALNRSDMESLTEEVLGLNYRGMRTLWTLVIFPRRVFKAFMTRDLVPYTPPLRIWLTLMSLGVLLSVLWGGYSGMLHEQFIPAGSPLNAFDYVPPEDSPELPGCARLDNAIGSFPATIQKLTGKCFLSYAESYGNWAAVLHAPLIGAISLINIFILGWMTRDAHWRSLWNIVFGFQVVASFVGVTVGTILMSQGVSPMITPLIVPLSTLYVFLRGGYGIFASTWVGLVVKSLLFAFCWMIILMLGSMLMTTLAMVGPLIVIFIQYG